MPGERRAGRPSAGSKLHNNCPVAALMACTFKRGVVMYMTPSTTIGVHSLAVAGRRFESPVLWIQATFRFFTFEGVICSRGE